MLHKIKDYEYFKIKAFSSHQVMNFYSKQSSPPPPNLMLFGTLLHLYVLEGEEHFKEKVDFELNRGEEFTSYTSRMGKDVEWLAKSVSKSTDSDILVGCQNEVAAIGQYMVQGKTFDVKGKFDAINVNDSYVVDLKTTSSINKFQDSIVSFNYQIQAAYYLMLAEMTCNKPFKDFFWLCAEKGSGKTAIIRCSDEQVQEGRNMIRQFFINEASKINGN